MLKRNIVSPCSEENSCEFINPNQIKTTTNQKVIAMRTLEEFFQYFSDVSSNPKSTDILRKAMLGHMMMHVPLEEIVSRDIEINSLEMRTLGYDFIQTVEELLKEPKVVAFIDSHIEFNNSIFNTLVSQN